MLGEVFKVILDPEQIKAKKEKLGARRFEIQLLKNDIGNNTRLIEKFSGCISLFDDIVSVHTALAPSDSLPPEGDCDLKYLYDRNTLSAIRDACAIADLAATNYGHSVGVVIHNSLSYREFSECPYYNTLVTSFIGDLLRDYKGVEIWIENVTPIHMGECIHLKNGCITDSSDIARHLREIFGNRIGSVFDVCHAVITHRMLKEITGKSVLADIYKGFSDTCKEVHFANAKEFGMKPGQHGCGFREDNEKDVEELKTYLFLCMTYFPAAYLCYEISEKDYIKCDAVSETLKIIQKLHN